MSHLEPRIQAFLAAARAQKGLPYGQPCEANLYSGKGLDGCLYPELRDCSGLVSVCIYAVDPLIDRRATWSADKYWKEGKRVAVPQPGDFVLFGSPVKASHIEIVMEDGRYFGAAGGNSDFHTPEKARAHHAGVRFRKSPRKDVLGFIANPLRSPA